MMGPSQRVKKKSRAPAARGNFRLRPAVDCLLLPGITVDECSDWLQY